MGRKYNEGVAEANRERTKHGGAVGARQGESNKMYQKWRSIKDRCYNPNNKHYHRYGGRGITMCKRWRDSFVNFYADIGDPPEEGMSLDRFNNDKGYTPNNVMWATKKEQANNRSTNVVVTHNGLSMTLMQWSIALGWKYGLIASRWKKGLRGDELFAPRKTKERVCKKKE